MTINVTEILIAILNIGLPLLATVALPLIPVLTARFFAWTKAQTGKIKNEYARGVTSRLSDLIGAKVLAYENTQIELLKERIKKGDIKKEELPYLLAQMKNKLIEDVKRDATAQNLLKDAVKVFGGDSAALGDWLSDMVETHVATLPASGLQTPAAPGQVPAVEASPVVPK